MIFAFRAGVLLLLLFACAFPTVAQDEGRIASDLRREREALGSCKAIASFMGCAETLATGQPFHLAFGSIAPQNGVAFGASFVEHKNFSSEWRMNWNVDAVASGNGSWRAGVYSKWFRLAGGPIRVVSGNTNAKKRTAFYRSAPMFNLYAQAVSLQHIDFYGLGPNTQKTDKTVYGERESMVGASAIVPLAGKLNAAILGELNGRFPSLRGNHSVSAPSIEQRFNPAEAPGLTQQTGFLQVGEGLRLRPSLFGDWLRLNYLGQFQQFIAPGASQFSFRRWHVDLGHTIPLYRNVRLTSERDQNGPDDCSQGTSPSNPALPCPHISYTQNLEGSLSVNLMMTASLANAGHVVPFYFDPTLGGSDLNGTPMLASYPDYRFRAPNLLLLRETFEHSLGKLPIGFTFAVDEGKVGMQRRDIDFTHLRHTFTTGLTVRAGGLPVMYLLFSWGGNEGHHTTATISNQLLGGSARPSLF